VKKRDSELVTCDELTGTRKIRRQTNSRSVKSRTGQLADYSQLAEMFDLQFGVYNTSI